MSKPAHHINVEGLRTLRTNWTAFCNVIPDVKPIHERRPMSRRDRKIQQAVDAIQSSGWKDADSFFELAVMLQDGEPVTLSNGKPWSSRDLLLAAIELDPRKGEAYRELGRRLRSDECANLPDGRTVSKQELLAVRFDDDDDDVFAQEPDEVSTSADSAAPPAKNAGIALTPLQVHVEVIRLDPNYGAAYFRLGNTLRPGQSVTLSNGKRWNRLQLFLAAIYVDPSNVRAHHQLGRCLASNQVVTMPDGRTMNKAELLAM